MAIHSIRLFGDPVLRQPTQRIESMSPEISKLVADMIETMRNAQGIGLAAPQIGRPERLFVVDLSPLLNDLSPEDRDAIPSQPMVFINPQVTLASEEVKEFEEGCLSIPNIREIVVRPESIRMTFHDHDMQEHSSDFHGILARVIQHEYDHLDGVLFTDHISSFRRQFLKRKLTEISRGKVDADYPVKSA